MSELESAMKELQAKEKIITTLTNQVETLKRSLDSLTYQADNVLKLQQKYFKGGRMEFDKKASITAEVQLRLLVEKLRKHGYGINPPPAPPKTGQAEMF